MSAPFDHGRFGSLQPLAVAEVAPGELRFLVDAIVTDPAPLQLTLTALNLQSALKSAVSRKRAIRFDT